MASIPSFRPIVAMAGQRTPSRRKDAITGECASEIESSEPNRQSWLAGCFPQTMTTDRDSIGGPVFLSKVMEEVIVFRRRGPEYDCKETAAIGTSPADGSDEVPDFGSPWDVVRGR